MSKKLIAAAVLWAITPVALFAQPQPTVPGAAPGAVRQAQPGQEQGQQAHAGQLDQAFVQCLITKNEAEISLAKIAKQRAHSDDVKKFADRMIKDHGEFVEKLRKHAGASGGQGQVTQTTQTTQTGQTAGGAPVGQAQANSGQTAAGGQTTAGGQPHGFLNTLMQIGKQADEQFLSMVQRDLEQKQGSEFDLAYIGGQIPAHMRMIADLTVMKRYVAQDLGQLLSEGAETAQHHLDEAKKICKSLEQSGTRATSTQNGNERQ